MRGRKIYFPCRPEKSQKRNWRALNIWVKCFRRRRRRRPERFRSGSGRPGFAPEITFDGYEGDIELPKLGNGEFFGHFDELDGKHFLDVSGKECVEQIWRICFFCW